MSCATFIASLSRIPGGGLEFAGPIPDGLIRAIIANPQRGGVIRYRQLAVRDARAVKPLFFVEGLQSFHYFAAVQQRQSAYLAIVFPPAALNCRMPIRQRTKCPDERPDLIRRNVVRRLQADFCHGRSFHCNTRAEGGVCYYRTHLQVGHEGALRT